MIKKFYIGISIIIFVLIIISGGCNASKPDLELVTEQGAGIQEFYVKDDKVYILGGVTIKNNTDSQLEYSLYATSESDYNSGLLKFVKLEGFDETISTNTFNIDAYESKTTIVAFVGDYGGYPRKTDRLMPTITIVY